MRRAGRSRHGVTLLELLIALPLVVTVGALAIGFLLTAVRHARRVSERMAVQQQLEGAYAVLMADMELLRAHDLLTVSDTLVAWSVPRWIGIVCAVEAPVAGGASLVVAALGLGDSTPALPTPALDVESWERDAAWLSAPPRLVRWSPERVERLREPDACPPIGPRVVPRWRVVLRPDSGRRTRPEVGFPMVFRRPVRFHHYASGGRWWLGRSLLTERGWATPQPVAGPLASPGAGGMRVMVRAWTGRPSDLPPKVTTLRIVLRGSDRGGRALDSIRMEALLAAATGTPP